MTQPKVWGGTSVDLGTNKGRSTEPVFHINPDADPAEGPVQRVPFTLANVATYREPGSLCL